MRNWKDAIPYAIFVSMGAVGCMMIGAAICLKVVTGL